MDFEIYSYPAFFETDEETGEVIVIFPDFGELTTFGEDFESAYQNAADAMTGIVENMEENGEERPVPSDPDSLIRVPGRHVVLVYSDDASEPEEEFEEEYTDDDFENLKNEVYQLRKELEECKSVLAARSKALLNNKK